MSVEAITVVLHHSRARGTAKLVLLGIANHDGDGGAWPSIETLCRYAGVSRRNVQKALDDLEGLGEIKRHRQAGGNGAIPEHLRPNLYEVRLSCPPDCDRTRHHRPMSTLPVYRVSVATPPVAFDTPPGVGSDTLTSPIKPTTDEFPEERSVAERTREGACVTGGAHHWPSERAAAALGRRCLRCGAEPGAGAA